MGSTFIMKVLLCLSIVLKLGTALKVNFDLDNLKEPLDNVSEAEFNEIFHKEPAKTEEEQRKREQALKANEKLIHDTNQRYDQGEIGWYDQLSDFSDLPAADFVKLKTGSIHKDDAATAEDDNDHGYALGRLDPKEEDMYDEESERYFDMFRYSRARVPRRYSSVKKGYVSPVKNQKSCGSCVAFGTHAAVEVCFKKAVGVFGDYSEQQLLDCGFGQYGASGCRGAEPSAYLRWIKEKQVKLAHETQYPYQAKKQRCPKKMASYNQGVEFSGYYLTYNATEELMKKMVHEHGAVMAGVQARGPFGNYGGGIFAGCSKDQNKVDHLITVVGYGTKKGTPYWLIKNSWGKRWGEKGYIRLKRGVNMCGIGKELFVAKCKKVTGGTTSAPIKATTQAPVKCTDEFDNCGDYVDYCQDEEFFQLNCKKTCKTCNKDG